MMLRITLKNTILMINMDISFNLSTIKYKNINARIIVNYA